MDRPAVIWSRAGGAPVKMGDLLITDRETRFSYDEGFLSAGDPNGLSLLAPPAVYGREPVVFESRLGFPFHPRLMAFVPGHGRHNIQRRIYERILSARKTPPAPGLDTDWELVLLAGRNGIGHLDVFRDDTTAARWYAETHARAISQADRHTFWRMIRDDIADDMGMMDAGRVAELLGPTPSVGGMIPKMLVSIPDNREAWTGAFAGTGTRSVEGVPYVEVLLKVEPREYEGVVALERLCLDLHRELGFRVPRYWHAELDGLRLLAVERFDLHAGRSIPMESFFSVFAAGSRTFSGNDDTDWEEVAQRMHKLAELVKLDVVAATRELYRRVILAFCTGNGDMHLENVSFLGGTDKVRLSPVYDPAPMRAWPQHDTRSAVPFPLEPGEDFFAMLAKLGKSFGFTRREALDVLDEILHATADYADRVRELDNVPEDRRERLANVVARERQALKAALPELRKAR